MMPLKHMYKNTLPGINHLLYMDFIKLFAKIGNSNTRTENIQSKHRNGFGIEKCAMLVLKSGQRYMTKGMELLNQEKMMSLKEKETHKYLRILEADTIKQDEMKDKIKKKSISGKRKRYAKQNYIVETLL